MLISSGSKDLCTKAFGPNTLQPRHIYKILYMYTSTYIYAHMHMYICTQTYCFVSASVPHLSAYVCMYVCIFVCMYVCM